MTMLLDFIEDQSHIPFGEATAYKSALWFGTAATAMGFPIAGIASEIYEDAVVLVPPYSRRDWEIQNLTMGRVLFVHHGIRDEVNFVIKNEDGVQSLHTYDIEKSVYFALPEVSENWFR